MENTKKITRVGLIHSDIFAWFDHKDGYFFERITKNGELALINWIQIIMYVDGGREVVVETPESNCILYFVDESVLIDKKK